MSDQRFKQKPLHGCSGCRQDFTSLALFDRHRVGLYEYTFEQGLKLDPPREDGRRCLDSDEMQAKGSELNIQRFRTKSGQRQSDRSAASSF